MGIITSANVATAIVKLVAADALPALMGNLVMGNLVNRDYEPTLARAGDTVNVPIPPVLVANNIAEGNTVQLQNPSIGNAQIVLNTHAEATFQIPDVTKILAVPDLLKLYMQPAVVAIAESIETSLLATWVQFTSNAAVGTGGTAITEAVVDSAETALFASKVPPNASKYSASQSHTLYLGTRYLGLSTAAGAGVSIVVDGVSAGTVNLFISAEDVLIRWPIGVHAAGTHSVTVTNAGPTGNYFYFDFFELAVPTSNLPTFAVEPKLTLATDWDTLHSLSLAPERTAWFIDSLGFKARQNHYVGALWFYELIPTGFTYASATATFSGTITVADGDASQTFQLTIGTVGSSSSTVFSKVMHPGDTPQTLAIALADGINNGSTGIWASASSGVLTITSRSIGASSNLYTLSIAATNLPSLTVTTSGTTFAGGTDGHWRTDLTASPRLNRAVRDWSFSYFTALRGYGIDTAASFSMELGNGDPSTSVGIAQEGPAGDPILLATPSLQTNFSPTSLAFWKEVYAEMAGIQAAAGLTPFLQFGEVQWWYFPNNGFSPTDTADYVAFSGMPFYDAWAQAQFLAQYGHAMTTFTTNTVDPAAYPNEVAFLQGVLGTFTAAIMTYVRATQPSCRFEVLYPTDVNATAFNTAFNFPPSAWTPAALTILKTECFGYTLGRDLDQCEASIHFGAALGFPASQRSHLVGVGDSTTAWLKEVQMAEGKGLESLVLFALDQYCLIGYATPLPQSLRRSIKMGT